MLLVASHSTHIDRVVSHTGPTGLVLQSASLEQPPLPPPPLVVEVLPPPPCAVDDVVPLDEAAPPWPPPVDDELVSKPEYVGNPQASGRHATTATSAKREAKR